MKIELSELPIIEGLNSNELSIEGLKNGIELINPILDWVELWKSQPEVHSVANWNSDDFMQLLKKLDEYSKSLQFNSTNWRAYLRAEQILEILKNDFPTDKFEIQINQTFSELVAFDRFLEFLVFGLDSSIRGEESCFGRCWKSQNGP